ncbi:hypothetical protein L6164_032968 [Bauhinia variegata]|uniref:Uncharacterized protein n=1 Tax=Bauhinia variegata TaxID=167791 RepID=A0ACB9KQD7_BAUVA|nr:hypothetical protein L6164_032968 [Bauhinia variegata]
MEESYTSLPTSHLLGSVPAVITEEKNSTNHEVSEANMQIFPPNNGGDRGRGYQTLGSPTVIAETFEQQPANNWRGVFSVSSYSVYFNVDTDIVLNRLISSMNPVGGDFFSKIDANPDLYGHIWISTTLVFILASLGNLATYLMRTSWSFDYLGSSASLVRLWCMWGYSLSIFIPASFLLLIPVGLLRWIIILLVGTASASFVSLNLKAYVDNNDLSMLVIAAFLLQMALAIFIKVWFFS